MQRHLNVETVTVLASSRVREPGQRRSTVNANIAREHRTRVRPKLSLNACRVAVADPFDIEARVFAFATSDHHDRREYRYRTQGENCFHRTKMRWWEDLRTGEAGQAVAGTNSQAHWTRRASSWRGTARKLDDPTTLARYLPEL